MNYNTEYTDNFTTNSKNNELTNQNINKPKKEKENDQHIQNSIGNTQDLIHQPNGMKIEKNSKNKESSILNTTNASTCQNKTGLISSENQSKFELQKK